MHDVGLVEILMQKRQVHRVDIAFVPLEVVALIEDLGHRALRLPHGEKFILRQQRRIARAHVSENDSAGFLARVCKMTN